MVFTHTQYLTEFSTPAMHSNIDSGKSPLAMLAKTCETIGLSDIPSNKKSASTSHNNSYSSSNSSESPKSIKHETISPKDENLFASKVPTSHSSTNANNNSASNGNNTMPSKQKPSAVSGVNEGKSNSPALTPKRAPIVSSYNPLLIAPGTSHADQITAATIAAMSQAQFANPMMRFPPVMGNPGSFNMPNNMSGPVFQMHPMMQASAMPKMQNQMEMMQMFAMQAQAAAYQNQFMGQMMPQPTPQANNNISQFQAYQSLMAAANGQTEKNECRFIEGSSFCGKSFATPSLLTQHMKVHLSDQGNGGCLPPVSSSQNQVPTSRTSSTNSPAICSEGSKKSSKSTRESPATTPSMMNVMQNCTPGMRYHPYMKMPMPRPIPQQQQQHQAQQQGMMPGMDQNSMAALNAAAATAYYTQLFMATGLQQQ
uniref:C2H2-type domain-containing protein n=1 Tax=Rhabditophanes sp. KR3021 TaxID=114890 RepID=A0AC35U7G7_9BILA